MKFGEDQVRQWIAEPQCVDTGEGYFLGSPCYIPPEVILGSRELGYTLELLERLSRREDRIYGCWHCKRDADDCSCDFG